VAIEASAAKSLLDENRQNTRIAAKPKGSAKPGARIGVAKRRLERDPGVRRGKLRVEDELELIIAKRQADRQDDEPTEPR